MNSYVTAIDLGTTKVVTLVGEKKESGYEIIAYREAPTKGVTRGEVVNIQNVLDSLIPLINDIKHEKEIEIKGVYVGIAGQNIQCASQRLSRNRSQSEDLISDAEVEDLKREVTNSRVNAGEKILHVIPQSYNVDDHIGVETASGMTGTRIEGDYKLFIGKIVSVEHSKLVIQRAGLSLKKLILEPVASAKAVLTEDEKEMGVAMIDMGGGTTDLLIYYNNIIRHSGVIPFGGNSITEDLRQGCRVSLRRAEQIKIQYGSCYSEFVPENQTVTIPGNGGSESRELKLTVIAGIIEARVEEIAEAIMYEIENSGYMDKLGAGIVLTGGGSLLTNISQFLSFKTGHSVRVAPPINNITNSTQQDIFKPEASTAIGLFMLGCERPNETVEEEAQIKPLFGKEEIEIKAIKKPKKKPVKKGASFKKAYETIVGNIFDNTNNEA